MYGHLWSCNVTYGMVKLSHVWSCIVKFDRHVGSCMVMHVIYFHAWSCLITYGQIWSCLIKCGKIGNIMNLGPRGNIGNMGSLEIIGKIRIKWKIWNIGKMGGKDYVYGK